MTWSSKEKFARLQEITGRQGGFFTTREAQGAEDVEAQSGRRRLSRRDGDGRMPIAARGDAAGVAETLLHISVGDRCQCVAQRFNRTERG